MGIWGKMWEVEGDFQNLGENVGILEENGNLGGKCGDLGENVGIWQGNFRIWGKRWEFGGEM